MFVQDKNKAENWSTEQLQLKPKGQYQLPNNIIRKNDIFQQTNAAFDSPNMCLFNTQLSQWSGKLRVNIINLQGKVTFGAIKKVDFQKANFRFTEGMNCQYLNSQGKHKNAQSCYITTIPINTHVDFFVKKSNLRVIHKNNNAVFNLPDKKNYFFFFAI